MKSDNKLHQELNKESRSQRGTSTESVGFQMFQDHIRPRLPDYRAAVLTTQRIRIWGTYVHVDVHVNIDVNA